MYLIELADIFGPHCTDADRAAGIREPLTLIGEQIEVGVSFAGVQTVSPSFATSLLLELDAAKMRFPMAAFRLTNMSQRIETVVRGSLVAVRSR